MEAIFHERQEGSLCAQHCLNALLQGSYFTAVDLADIAAQLDETERLRMAEVGLHTEAYRRFLQQPSSNFDDSGYFSIQVLQSALKVWGLDLVPYKSSHPRATLARQDPRTQSGYVCNFKDHWFSIRKLGRQWFNLNSLLTGPELISDTYLSMFLYQLQQEGYSIFIVDGTLPECEADNLLKIIPAVQPVKPSLLSESKSSTTTGSQQFTEGDLKKALEESKKLYDGEDDTLQKALAMSLQDQDLYGGGPSTSSSLGATAAAAKTPSSEEVREKRLAFLGRVESETSKNNSNAVESSVEDSKTEAGSEVTKDAHNAAEPDEKLRNDTEEKKS